jgi:hypothetical protein
VAKRQKGVVVKYNRQNDWTKDLHMHITLFEGCAYKNNGYRIGTCWYQGVKLFFLDKYRNAVKRSNPTDLMKNGDSGLCSKMAF